MCVCACTFVYCYRSQECLTWSWSKLSCITPASWRPSTSGRRVIQSDCTFTASYRGWPPTYLQADCVWIIILSFLSSNKLFLLPSCFQFSKIAQMIGLFFLGRIRFTHRFLHAEVAIWLLSPPAVGEQLKSIDLTAPFTAKVVWEKKTMSGQSSVYNKIHR